MPHEEERRARLYLARLVEPPHAVLGSFVAAVGAVEAAQRIARRDVPAGFTGLLAATAQRHAHEQVTADEQAAEKCGAHFVIPTDPEWPASLNVMAHKGLADGPVGAPLGLWVKGCGDLQSARTRSVAVVGTRAPSGYGESVTRDLVGDLVAQGWAVVSGAAYGIDAAGHRAALAAEAATVAVLACGIDRAYPAGHATLIDTIAARGHVVTEYPPGTAAARHRFLARNRIVAALAQVVVVVEAGRRSGAANTAAWARRFDIPVGAVPGPVTSAMSVGCHRMVIDGLAQLVCDAGDITALAGEPGGPGIAAPDRLPDLPAAQRQVLSVMGARPRLLGEIAFDCGLTVPQARTALAGLDLAGLVTTDGSGWAAPPTAAPTPAAATSRG